MAAKVELDIALRIDPRGGHERGRERVQSGDRRRDAFGVQENERSFDKMVARYASATPCSKKKVSMESSLTSSRDRYALNK